MNIIDIFNSTVSDAVNKSSEFYETFIGKVDFMPEVTIVEPDDIKCGALCNELEFARLVSTYYVQALSLIGAEAEELEDFTTAFIDLPRRGDVESDATYRDRFRFIITEKANKRRTTKWAILDALSYFVDASQVQLIEIFNSSNLYFQVRFDGAVNYDDTIFINNTEQAYVGQDFVGGAGIGEVITYVDELIQRIKAAGVDFDVYFIDQSSFTKPSDAKIGTVQMYKSSDTTILAHLQIDKTSDAIIV